MKTQSLTKMTIAVLAAFGALQAQAYVHESTGMDTQVDGIHEVDKDHLYAWKFVGANYDNNGPGVAEEGQNPTYPIIDDYGDHSTADFDANTYTDVAYTITGQTLTDLHPEIDYVTIYGAGLVYGSISSTVNSATVDGNVTLGIRDIGSQSSPVDTEINIFGGGGVETSMGDATVKGNVTVNVQNVYGQEVEIIGGGRINGENPPDIDNYVPGQANVTGTVSINVSNSDFGQGGGIYAGGDAEGEGIVANVGAVSVTVTDMTFDAETAEEPISAIFGGGAAYTKGTADVLGNVSINLVRSSVDIVAGGGETLNDSEDSSQNYFGKSAKVAGNVSIHLTDSTVETLLAGGTSDGAIWGDDEFWTPTDGQYGDASIGGDVTITLSGNTEVVSVYLAGSGVGSNVKGNSTLVIEGNNTTIGHIYGSGFYDSNVEKTAKIALSQFNGQFNVPFEGVDVVEAQTGSNVTLALDNTKVGDALSLTGAGHFTSGITLSSGNLTVDGNVTVSSLSLSDAAQLSIGENGTLTVTTDQIFTTALNDEGTNEETDGFNANGGQINFSGGTIAFDDQRYNVFYANDVAKFITDGTKVLFNGELIDVEGDMTLDEIADNGNITHSSVDVTVSGGADSQGSVTIDKSFGVSSIQVDENVDNVSVAADKTITLVGGEGKELISFAGEGDKSVEVGGTLNLGQAGSTANSGTLSTPVTVTEGGELNVNAGTFEIADVTVQSANLTVNNAQATIGALTLSGTSQVAAGTTAVAVNELNVTDGTHTVTGAVDAQTITGSADSVLNVGTTETRGDIVVGETSKLNGMAFFLDPAWENGMEVTDASRLVFKNATVDGKVVAGQNSYVVFGSGDTANFIPVFGKYVTWGGDKGVLAAAYVAQPITIAENGALTVDGTMTEYKAPTAGSVTFGANSVLVADVSGLAEGKALITANTFSVDKASKTVVVGDMKNGATYQLTDGEGTVWAAGNIISGNALWGLTAKDDGSFTVKLEDAGKIYGDLMQGTELANAGMQAEGAQYDYVNSLLTDASGNISALASTAARFDAAMNTAGAVAVFTNAYDRSVELREVVRAESSMDQEPRLWAHVMGGKNKLKGISSGAQAIHTETDHYGLVIGAEGTINNAYSLGVALAAGTGDTDNDSVGAKDDFDYYGISVYGRTTIGPVDLLGDVSATFLKSDLSMGGVADINASTDTAVYSAGVQAQKTFSFGWADLTPFVGIDLYHVRSDEYSAGHGIQVEDSDATAVEFPIGAKIAKSFDTAGGMHIAPSFSLAVVPTVADRDIDSKVNFAGATSTYNFTFADDVQVRSQLGVEASTDHFRFGLNAGYNWGNEERSDLAVQARVKYLF